MAVKILMVCLGNICRSPLAEGILASKLDPIHFSVDSAGTASWHAGSPPDERAIQTAKNHKIDISKQKARQFVLADFDNFDFIFAMDANNYKDLMQLAKTESHSKKIALLLAVKKPDPYYGTSKDFEAVYQMLDEACELIAKKLNAQ
jgi:protein-tyrosine phosphatase